jgi:molybdate transport system ATP-binding protein
VFPATIAEIGPRVGPIVDVRLDCSGDSLIARLTRFSVERLHLQPGARVHVLIKSVALDRRSLSGPWREGPAADVEALDS